MEYMTVKLAPYNKALIPTDKGELICYIRQNLKDNERYIRPAVIIVPGGAYKFISKRVMEPTALKFLSLGYNAFILNYSILDVKYPEQLKELGVAYSYMRNNSENLYIDPDRIALLGFSAGGHLCADYTNEYTRIAGLINENPEHIRPDICGLSYPVILSGRYSHKESFKYLCGDNPELIDSLSQEKMVNSKTCPTFIWATAEDNMVSCQNSIIYASKLAENNVPFELHVFQHGVHGLGICEEECINDKQQSEENKIWVDLCDRFFKRYFSEKSLKD